LRDKQSTGCWSALDGGFCNHVELARRKPEHIDSSPLLLLEEVGHGTAAAYEDRLEKAGLLEYPLKPLLVAEEVRAQKLR
jgi:hypothetical protein